MTEDDQETRATPVIGDYPVIRINTMTGTGTQVTGGGTRVKVGDTPEMTNGMGLASSRVQLLRTWSQRRTGDLSGYRLKREA
jgi:hypothetical protein